MCSAVHKDLRALLDFFLIYYKDSEEVLKVTTCSHERSARGTHIHTAA